MRGVAATNYERGQLFAGVVLVEGHEGPQDHELCLTAVRQANQRPVRGHADVPAPHPDALRVYDGQVGGAQPGATRVLGHRPFGGPLVEVLRVVDVIGAPQL